MIKKLRAKLILACMFSLAVVLLVILGGVNLMSYQKVVSDADTVLALLAANNGAFPQAPRPPGWGDFVPPGAPEGKPNFFSPRAMSPETPYESRFFSVLLGEDGQVLETNTLQIAAVDEEQAADYAQRAAAAGRTSGFLGNYRYLIQSESGGVRIIFLDCGRSLSSFRTTLLASVSLAVLGLAAVLFLLLILSRRIVRPMAESYAKQRQFITDAGHELKTPMTIISADADLAEMECGENQWLTDIRRQAQRLTALTNDLIYLSRMEEEQPQLQYIDFPISDVVEEMPSPLPPPPAARTRSSRYRCSPCSPSTGMRRHPPAGLHPAGQRPKIFSPRWTAGTAPGEAGAQPAAHRIQSLRPARGSG